MPGTDDAAAIAECTTCWRVDFAAPLFFALLGIGLWFWLLKQEPLLFCIDNDKTADGINQFKKVYRFDDHAQMLAEWEAIKIERQEFLRTKSKNVTFSDIFRDPKYKPLTLFAVLSSVINQMSGINAINVYSTQIL